MMAAGGAIIVIVVVSILIAIVRRRRRRRALEAPLPLIPFSTGRGAIGPGRPGSATRAMTPAFDHTNGATPAWSAPIGDGGSGGRPRASFAPPVNAVAAGSGFADQSMYPTPVSSLATTARPNDVMPGAAVDGASVRYWRAADGTLQFLPGRLEVIAGRDSGQEIRFVRTPGPDGTRVTFGRAEGAPYRHVQLREPTVSRAHARMTLEVIAGAPAADGRAVTGHVGRWRLENLSATNPVVVNGQPLTADENPGSSVVLGEGDRIEMGEVVFRFHER